MPEEIDTYSTDSHRTICPYCGGETEYDSENLTWEDDEEGDVECRDCGREYLQRAIVNVYRESRTLESALEEEIKSLKRNIEFNKTRLDLKPFLDKWEKELHQATAKLEELKKEYGENPELLQQQTKKL